MSAEFSREGTNHSLIIDDIFVFNGVDITTSDKYTLPERENLVSTLIQSVSVDKYYKLTKAVWYYNTIAARILEREVDIFLTHALLPKAKAMKYYWKKKPIFSLYLESITSTNNEDMNLWKLSVTQSNIVENKEEKRDNIFFNIDMIINQENPCESFVAYVPSCVMRPETGLPFSANHLVRMEFENGGFIPEQTCKYMDQHVWDTVSIYRCLYNNFEYSCISHRIIPDNTFKICKFIQDNAKKVLLNTYAGVGTSLLDLCSGKCYDYLKYKALNLKVSMYDIVPYIHKVTPNITYNCIDLLNEGIDDYIHTTAEHELFDTVSCFYGASIFFESAKTLGWLKKILDTNLKIGGKFLTISLSQTAINELLGDKSEFFIENQGYIELYIQCKLRGIFGRKTFMYMKGSHTVSEYNTELEELGKSEEYELESTGTIVSLLENTFTLSKPDTILGNIFKYYIFTKKEIKETVLPKIETLQIKPSIETNTIPMELPNGIVCFRVHSLNVVNIFLKILYGIDKLEPPITQETSITLENIVSYVNGNIECVIHETIDGILDNTGLNLYIQNNVLFIMWKPFVVTKLKSILNDNKYCTKGVKSVLVSKITEMINKEI